jgi:DNA-binding CsgD family transcriptional regulator
VTSGTGLAPADQTDRIQALWDELASYDVARHDDALLLVLRTLADLVCAQNAVWFAAVRLPDLAGDPILGWRPRFVRFLHPSPRLDEAVREQEARIAGPEVDVTTVRNVAMAGRLRAFRLVDLAPPEWFESETYRRYHLGVGHVDSIWAGCPVSEDVEVHFGLHRAVGQPRFTEAERDLVLAALRGLRWFHRQYVLGHGLLVARSPLSPTERRVLQGLLTGLSEKEIAAGLGRRPQTTHDHVKGLYRKFGVQSRAALMALWLGKLAR